MTQSVAVSLMHLFSHAASNCVGEIGQQLERPGGDKEWIARLVEEVIRADPKYSDFFLGGSKK